MAQWRIKPESKNSIYDRTCYKNGDNRVTVETVWRWGSFSCETEGNMFIDLENNSNLLKLPGVSFDTEDGFTNSVDTECDEETQEWVAELDESEIGFLLEDEGWESEWSEICIEDSDIIIERLDGPNAGKRYNESGTRVDEDGNLLPDSFDEENEESEDENLPALHVAVREDNLDKVRELIVAGADVQATAKNGATPLMFAAKNGNSEVVKLLLDSGANVLTQDDYCWTALLLAADSGSLDVVKLLLARGADVQTTDKYGKTALLKAVAEGNPEVVNQLLDAGADIQAKDGKGRTALMFAAERGHSEVVRLLLDKGADVQAKDEDGKTALDLADNKKIRALLRAAGEKSLSSLRQQAEAGNAEAQFKLGMVYFKGEGVQKDVAQGVEWLGRAAEQGHAEARTFLETLLSAPAEKGDTAQVKLLLEAGADVQAKDKYGSTALLKAAWYGHTEVVRLLLDKGADVQAKDNGGWTALMGAATNGHTELVRLLLDKGADVQAKDEDGKTALMYAAEEGHTEAVRLLLDKGADVQAKDEDGKTALMLAAEEGDPEAVRLLLDKGADVQAKENDGWTALMYAAANFGHTEAVKLLLEAGADPLVENEDGETALALAEEEDDTESIALLRAAVDAAAKQKKSSKGGKEKAGTSSAAPQNTGETPTTGNLQDRVFLFTGKLSVLSRKEAEELVRSAGARAVSALSGKVTDLVAGEKAGSKLDQAKEQGIAVMSEADFIKLMQELGLYQG